MITKDNLKEVLEHLGFSGQDNNYFKNYKNSASIKIDFENEKIIYPEKMIVNGAYTLNFNKNENFVVLECVDRLLAKGYLPEHIELEHTWKVTKTLEDRADILVKNQNNEYFLIIECKTPGAEYEQEFRNTNDYGGQLFRYFKNLRKVSFLCLYTSDFENNQIIPIGEIIQVDDNKEYLDFLRKSKKQDDEDIKGYTDATDDKDLYQVWQKTYNGEFLKGKINELFGNDIDVYDVGKKKYTINDLNIVNFNDIRTIYNDFAEILRSNAIGNYEHTFYILVDLFLCKIIDEKKYSDDLQFYYKGITKDNPLNYCDRLLNLYEDGVKELFGKKVVNHKANEIEKIFEKYKRYTGKLKDEIEVILKEQRFYAIKKFNFVDVENEEEFELNFKILIQITNLIQNIKITSEDSGANQFLGDLFEGFLNRSVHQTEGRFFTPTPITNFIIRSLPPLDAKEPRILDYACGAGHFLSEYIQYNKNTNAMLFGIEKNPELSRVAKIATYFYDDNATIVFQDTLGYISEKKPYYKDFLNGSFDLIISNPPYSVKGFLSTLDDIDRNKFKLTQYIDVKSYRSNNAIECFFIERAEQFLKENALLAVVLPISMLNKENIYSRTREIIFNSFEILSIVELGSRTFGSTGTQTFILFARKRTKNINDLITCFKENNFNLDILSKEFENADCIEKYCEFRQINKDEFIEFLCSNTLSDSLEDYFAEQREIFYSTSMKNKDKKSFKPEKPSKTWEQIAFEKSDFYDDKSTKKAQAAAKKEFLESEDFKSLLDKFYYNQFLEICKEIELEKLSLFAKIEDNEVIVVKSPNDKKDSTAVSNKDEIIKFLGYDWSNRKGDEGIKYQSSNQLDSGLNESDDDDDEDKKNKETLANINSIKYIQTALYNPQDENDKSKINYILHSFFSGDDDSDELIANLDLGPDSFKIFKANLSSLIDFNRSEFSNAINLNPASKSKTIVSKFPLKTVEQLLLDVKGNKPKIEQNQILENGKYPVITQETEKLISGYTNLNDCVNDLPLIVFGDHSCSIKYVDFPFVRGADGTQLLKTNEDELLLKYFYFYLQSIEIENSGRYERHFKYLKTEKIPLPPLEVQKQIIAECEKIDKEYLDAQKEIEKCKDEIENLFIASQKSASDVYKLSNKDVFEVSIGRRILSTEINENYEIPVYSANVFEEFGRINKLLLTEFDRPSVIWGIDGDWMVNVIPAEHKFYPTDHCGVLRIKDKKLEEKYVAWVLNKEGKAAGFRREYRASIDRIEGISIKVPSLAEQQKIVSQIEALEKQIAASKNALAACPARKADVLHKHLM